MCCRKTVSWVQDTVLIPPATRFSVIFVKIQKKLLKIILQQVLLIHHKASSGS